MTAPGSGRVDKCLCRRRNVKVVQEPLASPRGIPGRSDSSVGAADKEKARQNLVSCNETHFTATPWNLCSDSLCSFGVFTLTGRDVGFAACKATHHHSAVTDALRHLRASVSKGPRDGGNSGFLPDANSRPRGGGGGGRGGGGGGGGGVVDNTGGGSGGGVGRSGSGAWQILLATSSNATEQ